MLLSHPKFGQICEDSRVHQAPPPRYFLLGWMRKPSTLVYNTPSKHTNLVSDLLEVLPHSVADL